MWRFLSGSYQHSECQQPFRVRVCKPTGNNGVFLLLLLLLQPLLLGSLFATCVQASDTLPWSERLLQAGTATGPHRSF